VSWEGSACPSNQPSQKGVARAPRALPSSPLCCTRSARAQDRLKDCAQSSQTQLCACCHRQLQDKQKGSCPATVLGQPSKQGLLNPLLETTLELEIFIVRRKHKHPSTRRYWLAKMVARQRKESMLVKGGKKKKESQKQE